MDQQTAMDAAWSVVLAAASAAERASTTPERTAYALGADGELAPTGDVTRAELAWRPGTGWEPLLSPEDPRHTLIDLYLPICSATRARPMAVGHLGQSLDGFIATHAGESQYVTGPENILHLHRLRALCDAIVVGAGTVAADDPQLTTRHVPGPSPLRVILDPTRRLGDHYKVFSDESAETIYVCARSQLRDGETHFGRAAIVALEDNAAGVDVTGLVRLLHDRECKRIFVEGGGVTVSAFLAADMLDRLHIAIAPLIIGDGRPAIRLPPPSSLSDCPRPRYRVFKMGGDVLFDCELKPRAPQEEQPALPAVVRVI
jgi:diaminohydroxyphosphoribosylaminopyrimidine deaminase / 5-amino-6-(5-phosphoribosylamino)uracil reductase